VWRAENREKSNAYTDEWRRRNPVRLSLLKRKWRYGLAAEQFDAMLDEQNYEHSTGVVRGLLCGPCNRGIGQFADNATLLRRAADYLDSTQMKTWSDLHRADKVQRPAEQETTGPSA
jgi:Recombination endonuclease VII